MVMSAKKKVKQGEDTENKSGATDWLDKASLVGDLGQRPDFSEEECSPVPLWRVSQAESATSINSPIKKQANKQKDFLMANKGNATICCIKKADKLFFYQSSWIQFKPIKQSFKGHSITP